MNFDFSDEQLTMRDQIRRSLKKACPLSEVRRVFDGGLPYCDTAWKTIINLGLPAIMIDEQYGGLGLSALELCIAAEEIGRALAPVPFSSSIYFTADALSQFGSHAQKAEYLPALASGNLIGTYAISESSDTMDCLSPETYVEDGIIFGSKSPVPDGLSADVALVLARRSREAAADDTVLALVRLNQSGIERAPLELLEQSRPHAEISFSGAEADILKPESNGTELWESLVNRAAIPLSFEQLGGADAALDMAREYALQRKAFGRQIGSFQAIKHKLANMYIKSSVARANAYFGAWALTHNTPDLARAAAASLLSCSEAFAFAARENNQIHGGMSYCWETDCHFYYKRSQLLKSAIGSSLYWKEKLVHELERSNDPSPEAMLGRLG